MILVVPVAEEELISTRNVGKIISFLRGFMNGRQGLVYA